MQNTVFHKMRSLQISTAADGVVTGHMHTISSEDYRGNTCGQDEGIHGYVCVISFSYHKLECMTYLLLYSIVEQY